MVSSIYGGLNSEIKIPLHELELKIRGGLTGERGGILRYIGKSKVVITLTVVRICASLHTYYVTCACTNKDELRPDYPPIVHQTTPTAALQWEWSGLQDYLL